MEKRKGKRVRFFRLNSGRDIPLAWIFRRTNPDAVLGLLMDVGDGGIQVVTSKVFPIAGEVYQLTVHFDDGSKVAAIMNRIWSGFEGTLYLRSGFNFDEHGNNATSSVNKILNAQIAGIRWLCCEVLTLAVEEFAHVDPELIPN